MSNREAETQARITVQKELKAAARAIKTESFSIEEEISKRLSRKRKLSRGRFAETIENVMDEFCEGRLLSKENIMTMQRSSKHAIKRWSYLERNDEYPFEYFENQIFSIFDFFMNTRKPQNSNGGDSGIRITRHCLERVSERFQKTTLPDVLDVVSIYASAIGLHSNKFKPFIEKDQIILLSRHAYLVIKVKPNTSNEHPKEFNFIITTILPRHIWSKRRKELLEPALASIDKFEEEFPQELSGETLMMIRPSYINNTDTSEFCLDKDSFIYWIAQ